MAQFDEFCVRLGDVILLEPGSMVAAAQSRHRLLAATRLHTAAVENIET